MKKNISISAMFILVLILGIMFGKGVISFPSFATVALSSYNSPSATLALPIPTLAVDSPVAQFVIGGTSASSTNFTFKTSGSGSVTITDLGFILDPITSLAITSITAGGITMPVSQNATTTLSGLNIAVPVSNSGTEVPVTVSYNVVGTNGIKSNVSVELKLVYIKYSIVTPISASASSNIASNPMTPVAGYPIIALANPNTKVTGLQTGIMKIGSVTITAVGNIVNITKLPITIVLNGGATISSPITLQYGSSTLGSTGVKGVAGTNILAFNNFVKNGGYQIMAGQSKTFDIYATISGKLIANSAILTTKLGSASLVSWDDVNGGATGLNALLIPNYSTTASYSVANY